MTKKHPGLAAAIAMVNTYNRPSGKPLVVAVRCDICGAEHARMATGVTTGLRGKRTVCLRIECQRAARRQRQGSIA